MTRNVDPTLVLRIGSGALQTMLRHAERDQPCEAVGMLAGDSSGTASLALPLANLAGPRAFLADPYTQYLAEKRIAAEGLSLVAIYHSHPGGGASLSPSDHAFAKLRDTTQIVIALAHDNCPQDIRAYRVCGDTMIPVTLQITPDTGRTPQ